MDLISSGSFANHIPGDIITNLLGHPAYRWLTHLNQRRHRAATITLLACLGLLKIWASRLALPQLSPPSIVGGGPSLLSRVGSFFTSSISIPSGDRLATDLLRWHTAHIVAPRGSRVLTATSQSLDQLDQPDEDYDDGGLVGSAKPSIAAPWDDNVNPGGITYSPNLRNTWFFHDRRLFFLHLPTSSVSSRQSPSASALPPKPEECLRISCWGWSVAPIQSLLGLCNSASRPYAPETVKIHLVYESYGSWTRAFERMSRHPDTVHLDEDVKRDLLADMRRYLDPEERRFYYSQGIPYRRGYLFYGPPGTGKTSLSIALAGMLRLPLYILPLPMVANDTFLQSLLRSVESRSIVLIEDVDAMAMNHERRGDGSSAQQYSNGGGGYSRHGGCTLSGLLNALDGVTSQEGRIVIMTTNHPHLLDRALKRPGRIDMEVYLGYMSRASARDMFLRMLGPDRAPPRPEDGPEVEPTTSRPVSTALLAETFGHMVASGAFTPAQIQGFLLPHRGDPTAAVQAFPAWAVALVTKAAEHDKKDKYKQEADKMGGRDQRRVSVGW